MALSRGVRPLIHEIEQAFGDYEQGKLTFKQEEVLGKFCSKTGKASHSYEGIVKEISYGYGLKKQSNLGLDTRCLSLKKPLVMNQTWRL